MKLRLALFLVGTVTGEAVVREDGPNVAVEADRLLGLAADRRSYPGDPGRRRRGDEREDQ
jgi:hypothetical protein